MKFNPPNSDAPAGDDSVNALWRVPEWFPALSAETLMKLKVFHTELLRFNNKINLISKSTEREADSEHFADCILAFDLLQTQNLDKVVYDVGAGNGFPGIVLAILDPSREFRMIESDLRKSEFIKHMAHTLQLNNVQIMNVRLETLVQENIKCAVSRGFASITRTTLACNKVMPVGARFFHMKGRSWSSEVAELPVQLIALWKPELVGDYTIPRTEVRRSIVLTQKIG